MSTLRANTLKPITSGNSLVLQGDSGGSGVSGPSIDSNGDVDFSQNTNAKVKLPSGGGIYESDGSTEILTESSGIVSLKNTIIHSTSTNNISVIGFSGRLNADESGDSVTLTYDTGTDYMAQGVTNSSGVITFPTAGKYFVSVVAMVAKGTTTAGHFASLQCVNQDGTAIMQTALAMFNSTGSADQRAQISSAGIFDLSANNTLKIVTSRSGTVTYFGGRYTRFSAFRIGA
jgi:hypothetical protein